MSKKKTKTRIEKEQKTHRLDHVAKSSAIYVGPDTSAEKNETASKKSSALSPLNRSISRDLRTTIIVIAIFVIAITASAYIAHQTELLNPLLSRWNIKY